MNDFQTPSKRMEQRVATLEERVKTLSEHAHDLETRLRGIEKSVWKSTGVLAVFQFILTSAAVAVVKLLIK